MGTILTFDKTGRLTSHSGKVARQVRVPLVLCSRADRGAARDHGHHHRLIHAASRQTEGVRAPCKTGVQQSIASSHSLRARSVYPRKQWRRFDRL